MKNIISFMGKTPKIGDDVYIDPTARIVGDVILRKGCSVWPLSVLRADSDQIVIEEEAAVLDKVLIESPAQSPVIVGKRALVSHGAILHGCRVGERALIGIGAIILDGAVVGTGAMIGAGSVVSPSMIIPPSSLVLGIPGKVIRPLRPGEVERITAQVDELKEKAHLYRISLKDL
jgi:carbonic anhydrase/acetyltransferase-like protein (isoleucine patch superfamily)